MATRTEKLPKGWTWDEWQERRTALAKLPPAVRRLLAFEWARRAVEDAWRVLPIFEARFPKDLRPREAIEAAEKVITAFAADAAYAADAADAAYAADAAAYAANAAFAANAADAADAAYVQKQRWRWLYATYRHACGPRDLQFDPAWRTTTAVALARGIVAERAFDRMPILADALQDAGCDHPELIAHLQQDAEEWTAADWALWQLLEVDRRE